MTPRLLPSLPSPARLASVLVLGAGALLYLTRDRDPAAVAWLREAGFVGAASALHATREGVHATVHLPSWLQGSASDAAFGFALGAFLSDARPAVLALGLAVALGHEVGQGFGFFSGTFDVTDLYVILASFVVAIFAFRSRPSALSPTLTRNGS